jgi:DNA invertase Pin-like site-specific DNA recombinase
MDQHFATRKCHFLGSLGRRVQLGQAAPLYCRISTADQTCARQERDLRAFAKKVGYKIVGVWNEIPPGQSRSAPNARRSWHLAQARTVALILVTELTRWGRSARFAARPLACFKFRFVSSPQIVDSIRLDPEMLWQTA